MVRTIIEKNLLNAVEKTTGIILKRRTDLQTILDECLKNNLEEDFEEQLISTAATTSGIILFLVLVSSLISSHLVRKHKSVESWSVVELMRLRIMFLTCQIDLVQHGVEI